jgi:hypothetical protein
MMGWVELGFKSWTHGLVWTVCVIVKAVYHECLQLEVNKVTARFVFNAVELTSVSVNANYRPASCVRKIH